MAEPATGTERVRAAEVIASLCLATDLGMWFPFEHGLKATSIAMRLCDALGVDHETASQTYYTALLLHIGCTTDAEQSARVFSGSLSLSGGHSKLYGSPLESARVVFSLIPQPDAGLAARTGQLAAGIPRALRFRAPHFTAICEVAQMVAEGVGLPPAFSGILYFLVDRWDGWGHLRRAKGDQVPLPLRIAHVAADAMFQRLVGDDDHVVETIGSRAGHAFDPAIARTFVDNAPDILGSDDPESVWDGTLAAEPKPWLTLENGATDRALVTMGAFADLASPYLSGHAAGVGDLAARAAELMGKPESEVTMIRRAGYLHDIGRTAVDPRIWMNPSALSAGEWEQVRLHPYHTQRVFARSPFLAPLAEVASAHHERLDGSGYHRGSSATLLPPPARLLAAADAFRSKIEPRPYRKVYSPQRAASIVAERARDGRLDPEMVAAVVEATGQDAPRMERPAGLTEREVEVLAMLARGKQTKQVAHALGISTKTADRHIQNAYRKMGVSTRAAATLFAAEHGLVTWG